MESPYSSPKAKNIIFNFNFILKIIENLVVYLTKKE